MNERVLVFILWGLTLSIAAAYHNKKHLVIVGVHRGISAYRVSAVNTSLVLMIFLARDTEYLQLIGI